MTQSELKKAQYDILNKEILENSTKIYQVLNFCVTAVGALLVLGLGLDSTKVAFGKFFVPFVSLLPFAVILPSIMLVESLVNSTARIASYLNVAYEKSLGGGWQTHVQLSRKADCPRRSFMGISSMFLVLAILCLVSSVTSLIWVIQSERNVGSLFLGGYVAVVLLLMTALFLLRARLGTTYHQDWFSQWEGMWIDVLNSAHPKI
jgi:hypothetical protein